jgi:hypothetical protein
MNIHYSPEEFLGMGKEPKISFTTFFFFYFLYLYVHTMIGSLLPSFPHPLPFPHPSLSPPPPSFQAETVLPLSLTTFLKEKFKWKIYPDSVN